MAVLLDNFVNASARDEEKEQLRKIEEAKSYKVPGWMGGWVGAKGQSFSVTYRGRQTDR